MPHRTALIAYDIQDDRLQPCSFCQALTVLNFFSTRRRNQYVDVARSILARAHHAEIETYLVERKGNVLVGF